MGTRDTESSTTSIAMLQRQVASLIQLSDLLEKQQQLSIHERFQSDLAQRAVLRQTYKSKKNWRIMLDFRLLKMRKLLEGSVLFDSAFYLHNYPEIALAGMDPVIHYLEHGVSGYYDPHPLFSTRWYLKLYPDVAASGINPLLHFIEFGAREFRVPHPLFDPCLYVSQYPDVFNSGMNLLEHYVRFGGDEGRRPHWLFHAQAYLEHYPEIRGSGMTPLEHYCRYGRGSVYQVHQLFNPVFYLSRYVDVLEQSDNPLIHYLVTGADEGRDPSSTFSTESYRKQFPDLKRAGINPLVHFASRIDYRWFMAGTNETGESLERVNCESVVSQLADLSTQPLISVVMPVYNTPLRYLKEAIDSVIAQVYKTWELCIVDDASTDSEIKGLLQEYERSDLRIKVVFRENNGNISTATNSGFELAAGEYIALLDHDDLLTWDALAEVVLAINADPDSDILYSDQDKIDEFGALSEPFFKPDWSPDYFCRVMYVGHLLVFRRNLLDKVGGCDPRFDKVQDYELMLRLSEVARKIHHIPRILYHWRTLEGSVARDPHGKSDIDQLQVEAVSAAFERRDIAAKIQPHSVFSHRAVIVPADRVDWPLVSIIIPTKDAPQHIGRCLESIYTRSTYPNYEVIVIDNNTTDPVARHILDNTPAKLVKFIDKFNYSRANNIGVQEAAGEYVILLNNDTEVITPRWIEFLLFGLEQKDVAAVGSLLLYPDNTVQHAGVVLGCRGTADHVMRYFPADSDGYAGSLSCTREVSAVTAACMMCRRADYLSSGSMIEFFGTHYQDVDFCLRLAVGGKRILFVPQAVLYHYESTTRGAEYDYLDRLLLLDLWQDRITQGDPYYNRNLSLESLDYRIKGAG
ncbi:glycosyltransferase family 2 protein [Trichlorobacter lovleyi]|uniref:Glycosyl transferase family 2 n=1 Tax=Trichlorobacter lovleyi (strain ATCC BAA-1151 / DSM 17278 / SZ) TaxID=398767 RepID=B3E8X3_TRIL1|nr:glycosyltransferase family 2 protein [Trichlorobacter lovleyi]ACD95241.1 glycosyl transferase family 2 [Trichlorobacter lovleyi SZ]